MSDFLSETKLARKNCEGLNWVFVLNVINVCSIVDNCTGHISHFQSDIVIFSFFNEQGWY